MNKSFIILILLFVMHTTIFYGQVVQRRVPVRSNINAFSNALKKIDSEAEDALAYKAAIEKFYNDLILNNNISSDASTIIKEMKDKSLKAIDDKAYKEYGDYSRAYQTARYEYETVTAKMVAVAKKDLEKQKEAAYNENSIYQYTHPFDTFDYSHFSKIILNPAYESKSTSTNIKITKIALSQQETRIEFLLSNRIGVHCFEWANINPQTYLYIPNSKKKYPLYNAINIALSPNKTYFHYEDEQLVFALVFPPIPSSTKTFNVIEQEKAGWNFYNIHLK